MAKENSSHWIIKKKKADKILLSTWEQRKISKYIFLRTELNRLLLIVKQDFVSFYTVNSSKLDDALLNPQLSMDCNNTQPTREQFFHGYNNPTLWNLVWIWWQWKKPLTAAILVHHCKDDPTTPNLRSLLLNEFGLPEIIEKEIWKGFCVD